MGNSDIWAPLPPAQIAGSPSLPAQPQDQPVPGGSTFSIGRETSESLTAELASFCETSGTSYAALVSENGVTIAQAGPARDLLGRSSEVPALAIGAFFATRELAGRLGENQFEGLYQQGASRHLFLAPVGSHLLLAVFSAPTNVGIVRLCAADSSSALTRLLDSGKSSPLAHPTSPPQTQAPQRSPEPPPLPSQPPFSPPVNAVSETLARPAPTGHLWQDTSPAVPSSPIFPQNPPSKPHLAAPTIAAFERQDPPTKPFPSG